MNVSLAYGEGRLSLELPETQTTLLLPRHLPGLPDERAALMAALDQPIGAASLRSIAGPNTRICLLFTDITRATPNHRLVPWLLDYLAGIPTDHITLLNQTGTHRGNTASELARLLSPEVVKRYRVVNHNAEDADGLVAVGSLNDGTPAMLNRRVVEADLRLLTGFIEPHFFAGFSGGPKAIIPGCAGLATIMSNHGTRHLNHPEATFGITEGNPLWEELRTVASRVGPSFLVNVTLNQERAMTGVFAGDMVEAHRAGCEVVRRSAMQEVNGLFDLVITTNSGYPLDLNLYQGVKGLCAAARIVRPGGTIILASECREGVPAGSPFERLLQRPGGAQGVRTLAEQGFSHAELWQVQMLARVQDRASVLVHSSLTQDTVRSLGLTPCGDLASTVERLQREAGPWLRVAVLPEGPLTIPYVASAGVEPCEGSVQK
jgi:nickel-dependent lactate racemase